MQSQIQRTLDLERQEVKVGRLESVVLGSFDHDTGFGPWQVPHAPSTAFGSSLNVLPHI